MKLTEEQKNNFRYGLRLIGALGLEHGLRFLPEKDPTRKLIEEDIRLVRTTDDYPAFASRYKQAKKRKVSYSVPGLLTQGAQALLYLAKHGGYPTDGLVRRVLYFPTEAGYMFDIENHDTYGAERRAECAWQETNLWPLRSRLFAQWGEAKVVQDFANFKEAA